MKRWSFSDGAAVRKYNTRAWNSSETERSSPLTLRILLQFSIAGKFVGVCEVGKYKLRVTTSMEKQSVGTRPHSTMMVAV